MKPLPDLPHRDDEPDLTADMLLWAMVFIGIGLLILANLPSERAGGFIFIAGLSAGVGGWFLFRLIVRGG
jgi:hypothetical protein